ncbi:hypothetical protein E4T39_00231 [Aureobasidium subglaciale]|nr:hypothetical protein E4T39_00231 [Aureobasidium subglaciale]
MNGNKRPRLEHRESISSETPSKAQLTRACAECKKHKVKCFVQPGETSCNKCVKSGIICVPHNFAQKFIDEDATWKSEADITIDRLKAAVQHLLQLNHLPKLELFNDPQSLPVPVCEVFVQTLSPTTTHTNSVVPGNFISEGPSADHHEDDSDLVPLPMNNLYNLTEPGNSRLIRVDPAEVNGPDFISRGVVSIAEAEYLFCHFRDHINPQLWDGVLCSHGTLQGARQSSTLLIATVLTVAALHLPDREQSLHATYDAFVSLMRGSCMLRSQNLDDIRGLCIGAFYLTSLSWALCSRAVRIATEMNLHKSSLQFSRGSIESYERVRLWYVLYVCDHQFALAYGRPPMMHEDAAIRNAEKMLTSGLSSKGDWKLVAQVELFRILAGAYFMYGCDPDLELNGSDFEMLQSFNISVDQWRLQYQPKDSGPASHGVHPAKGTALYYHLARFQLNSLSLRGISARSSESDMSWDRKEAANNAIAAATNTLRLIIEDVELRNALIGMPIFTHAMIAVCASFLIKMAVVYGVSDTRNARKLVLPRNLTKYGLNFHTKDALCSVETLVLALKPVADNASQRHVARQVITGLEELLQRFARSREGDLFIYSPSSDAEHPAVAVANHGPSHSTATEESLFAPDIVDVTQANYILPGSNQDQDTTQLFGLENAQQDPFDLLGDLDWRFNDSFLWGIDSGAPYI